MLTSKSLRIVEILTSALLGGIAWRCRPRLDWHLWGGDQNTTRSADLACPRGIAASVISALATSAWVAESGVLVHLSLASTFEAAPQEASSMLLVGFPHIR